MRATKDELERSINNADVFGIDPQHDAVLYRTARSALLQLIVNYYANYVYPNRPQEEYGFVLIATAAECIKYYNREKGDFLHLLNYSVRRNMSIEKAKQMQDARRQGIKISNSDALAIQRIIALANSKNLDISSCEVQSKISQMLNISLERVSELIETNENAVAVGEYITNDDGENISIFQTIISPDGDPQEKLESVEAIEDAFRMLNKMFQSVQVRSQKLLSMLLTSKILEEFGGDFEPIRLILEAYSFYSPEIAEQYIKKKKIPTARQIAEICGVSEQSASRTYRNFLARRSKYE